MFSVINLDTAVGGCWGHLRLISHLPLLVTCELHHSVFAVFFSLKYSTTINPERYISCLILPTETSSSSSIISGVLPLHSGCFTHVVFLRFKLLSFKPPWMTVFSELQQHGGEVISAVSADYQWVNYGNSSHMSLIRSSLQNITRYNHFQATQTLLCSRLERR